MKWWKVRTLNNFNSKFFYYEMWLINLISISKICSYHLLNFKDCTKISIFGILLSCFILFYIFILLFFCFFLMFCFFFSFGIFVSLTTNTVDLNVQTFISVYINIYNEAPYLSRPSRVDTLYCYHYECVCNSVINIKS